MKECKEKVRESIKKVGSQRMETQYEIEEVKKEANEKVRESIAEINKVKRVASRKVSAAWEDAKKAHLRAEAAKD